MLHYQLISSIFSSLFFFSRRLSFPSLSFFFYDHISILFLVAILIFLLPLLLLYFLIIVLVANRGNIVGTPITSLPFFLFFSMIAGYQTLNQANSRSPHPGCIIAVGCVRLAQPL